MPQNITDERASRRFHQMALLEKQIQIKTHEIVGRRAELKEAKQELDALIVRLRTAARDEGELPLFDLDGD